MKKKITLPFENHPITSMYHNLAFPMGIIQGNTKEDIIPWLCGKFFNCSFNRKSENQFNLSFAYSYFGEDKILFEQKVQLMREFYGMIGLDILKLFRQMLSNGHYIQSSYNEEFIPGKWAYQNSYYQHDFLLIGYDDVKKVFLSVGYLKDRKFQRYEIPYSNMLQSILSLRLERLWFSFWTYNTDARFTLNFPRVVLELLDYLNSTTSLSIYQGENLYGLAAIDALGILFVEQAGQGKPIDFRYTRGLMEHKYLMQKRIVYLIQQDFGIPEYCAELARQVYKMSEKVHLLGLKHLMTGKREIIDSIRTLITGMNDLESDYLPQVLDALEKKHQEAGA